MIDQTEFLTHLKTGNTTVCRCWSVTRNDGVQLGFTDHDGDLEFDGLVFKAGSGLSAVAVQQTTGLAVDNTEALGALTDEAISHADIEAGRFDGAEVSVWLVNWSDPAQHSLQFRGHIGEIKRGSHEFTAELRGLTDALNQPRGRAYQPACSAVLGDAGCKFDTLQAGFFYEGPMGALEDGRVLKDLDLSAFDLGWFSRGVVEVLTGSAKGLRASIKQDHMQADVRVLQLWEPIRAASSFDDIIRVTVGCDKQFGTCQTKFQNVLNFQGFPHIPGEDWLVTSPVALSARSWE
ncbi:DUF2163 domain-containing protein [Algirhabdus cladophorae]|uniref:DUF2163 domain-containing protein n=1 Tax=Algirhabdus cladophorae TaxID=3377108 RepID=UPI003B84A68C